MQNKGSSRHFFSEGLLHAFHPRAPSERSRQSLRSVQAGGLFQFQTPPPKIFESVFLQSEIFGRRRPRIFSFLPFLRRYVSFFTLCVYTQNTQNFVENSKNFEKHRKFLYR